MFLISEQTVVCIEKGEASGHRGAHFLLEDVPLLRNDQGEPMAEHVVNDDVENLRGEEAALCKAL